MAGFASANTGTTDASRNLWVLRKSGELGLMENVKSITFVDAEFLDGEVYRDKCTAVEAGNQRDIIIDSEEVSAIEKYFTAHPDGEWPVNAANLVLKGEPTAWGSTWFAQDDSYNHVSPRFKIKKTTQVRFWSDVSGGGTLIGFIPFADIAYCGPTKPTMIV